MMPRALEVILPLLGPATLIGVAILSPSEAGRSPRRTRRALALASTIGVGSAIASVGLLVYRESFTPGSVGPALGGPPIRIDGLSVTILSMVALLVWVIGRFSNTYLEGDDRHGPFLGRLAATAASVEVLVLADHLLLFWVAWVSTSICLHGLLVFYPHRPRAVLAARKKMVVARIGDGLLACALLLLYQVYGTASLGQILTDPGAATGLWGLSVAAIFLALTALLKSAQFPTHGWLVEVMETPTPVSALLHAGILNAGPFLILRFSPVVGQVAPAAWLLVLVGGFTAAFASVVIVTQPSVKVALGYSSVAHMGFMLFVCGLGVYPAAALHLVAHSFYKAHAFLSAGSIVDVAQASRVAVLERRPSLPGALIALIVATGTYLGVAWVMGFSPWASPSLVLVGAILVIGLTQLVGAGTGIRLRAAVQLQVLLLAAVTTIAFFVLEELARLALSDSLPHTQAPATSVLALGGAVVAFWSAIIAVQLLGWGRETRFARELRVHLRHGLYANAWFDRLVAKRAPLSPRPPLQTSRS